MGRHYCTNQLKNRVAKHLKSCFGHSEVCLQRVPPRTAFRNTGICLRKQDNTFITLHLDATNTNIQKLLLNILTGWKSMLYFANV